MYTILNPHIIDFVAEPVLFKYAKRRPLKKYSYLLTEAIEKHGSINILADSTASGMIPMKIYTKLPFFLRSLFTKIEINWWKKRNNFTNQIKVYYKPNKIENKDYLVFFNYKHYQNAGPLLNTCNQFKHVIAHLSHYHNATLLQSKALKNITNICLAADVDISNNEYFKKYFGWYNKPIFHLAFAVEHRFQLKKEWSERQNKALSVGTFHYLKESYESGKSPELKEFIETSNETALHPIRREIFEKKEQLEKYIDCMNAPYVETDVSKSIKKFIAPTNLLAGQKKYFSFDIVEKFNDYQFAIVGEELITGLPGIGSFEAMACGCILLANPTCYKGINAIEGTHYLPAKNLNEMIEQIANSKIDINTLEQLSTNASIFAIANFNAQTLYNNFEQNLKDLN